MIANEVIRNCEKSFPAIQIMANESVLGKILIKNLYQNWKGENISQIKERHETNPYNLRIGLPHMDKEMRNDSMYFILNYLSYNPVTKDIEKRELLPYRNVEKIYIGQSLEENSYSNYGLFVNNNIVANDVYIKGFQSIKDDSIGQLLVSMINKVEKLQEEIANLKRQLKNGNIYRQDIVYNEQFK